MNLVLLSLRAGDLFKVFDSQIWPLFLKYPHFLNFGVNILTQTFICLTQNWLLHHFVIVNFADRWLALHFVLQEVGGIPLGQGPRWLTAFRLDLSFASFARFHLVLNALKLATLAGICKLSLTLNHALNHLPHRCFNPVLTGVCSHSWIDDI